MDALTKFAGACAAVALSTIWMGYVLSVLWVWFIVATFSAPLLSIPAAIGLIITARFVTTTLKKENTNDVPRTTLESILIGFLHPLMVLGLGWIVKGFL